MTAASPAPAPTRLWKRTPDVAFLNRIHENTLCASLGIEFLAIGDDWLKARMPVDRRTVQPMGIVHGGASVSLAETLGSVASWLCIADEQAAVGLEVNANHLRAVRSGWVYGECRAIHVGRSTHVWQIELSDDQGRRTCVSRLTTAIIARPPASAGA